MANVIAGKLSLRLPAMKKVSKRRVQDVTSLAVLAPERLKSIAVGKRTDGLTAVWSEQLTRFASF